MLQPTQDFIYMSQGSHQTLCIKNLILALVANETDAVKQVEGPFWSS